MKSSDQKALFNLMVDFYNITTDRTDDARIRGLIGSLVRKARKLIPADADTKTRVHKLLQLVYGDWGFHCDPEHYFESDNLYINQVLANKTGMPVSLGAIVLYLAASLDLPVYPVNFPTQLVLRSDIDGETAFIDPWDGSYISHQTLATWFEGYLGFGNKLTAKDVAAADYTDLAYRFNQVAKHTLMREQKNLEALEFIDHLLIVDPQDPYEIRDRGFVLANMECLHAAISDFDYFIEHCPEDPTAWLLAAQLPSLKQVDYPLH
ncbi:regulator of sirC expression with transglutaminase-like and TPR domain [Cricetibacter osteomyelitidis]|uniref:Regulator of sirC expression with transglutaminase-like and TPR domain n=1 Tax=Cricetibacter osteomyelitidis TaxID=1521931 RepID=A0A4V2T1F7_9PAST|nr:SirB1 family protein [Cricetibacter osteomyelitidis]TCP93463.1 regulator of sirC expression with transglutaminase-like and TPR domain [Cricetibacter osteomyelitidis]